MLHFNSTVSTNVPSKLSLSSNEKLGDEPLVIRFSMKKQEPPIMCRSHKHEKGLPRLNKCHENSGCVTQENAFARRDSARQIRTYIMNLAAGLHAFWIAAGSSLTDCNTICSSKDQIYYVQLSPSSGLDLF